MMPKTVSIPTIDSHPVTADLYLPRDPRALCILCHGFKGYRKWGFFPYLAGRMAEVGMAAMVIDFSHNGTIPEDGSIVEQDPASPYVSPRLFAVNTLSRELSDLECAVSAVVSGHIDGAVDSSLPLALMGHSRGGVSALLIGAGHGEIAAVAAWSTPTHPDLFGEEQKERWRAKGSMDFTDSLTGMTLTVSAAYLEDLEENHSSYDPLQAVRSMNAPSIFVHGTADVPIPPISSVRLYDAMRPRTPSKLLLIRTGHTFGVGPRFVEEGFAIKQAAEETVDWLSKVLMGGSRR